MKNFTHNFRFIKMSVLLMLCIIHTQLRGQNITTIAGTGVGGYSGDGGAATAAEIYGPWGVIAVNAGSIYFADGANFRVRKISPLGIITTVAGNGSNACTGDGTPATAASFRDPLFIAFDNASNLYIGDPVCECVRKVDATSGIITNYAGDGFSGSFSYGDGGPATAAEFSFLSGIAFDNANNLYISDQDDYCIRYVDYTSGNISTVAGTNILGFSGDGGPATVAELYNPIGVYVDHTTGNVYFSDSYNNRIRKINTSGIISTVVGNGTLGYSGDGGLATSAEINRPFYVVTDNAGELFFGDTYNSVIRKVNTSGIIETISGNGTAGYAGDGGPATSASVKFDMPEGIALDCPGNIYISDENNNRLRMITNPNHAPMFVSAPRGYIYLCGVTSAFSIDTILKALDIDTGQLETWSVLLAASHGTVVGSYTRGSTGNTLTPVGLSYTPTIGYTGLDSFKIIIADCAGAADTITVDVFVNTAISIIGGPSSVCIGSTITLTDSASGGVWRSGNTTVATVDSVSGIVEGLSIGVDTISYANSCGSKIKVIAVNPLPAAVSGSGSICAGASISLSDASSGGTWASGAISIATVGSTTGIVTGASGGVATISYILSATGCMATASVTVNPLPESISPTTATVCVGGMLDMSDAITGGTWSTSSTTIATIGTSSGILYGVSAATVTVNYTLGSGCYITGVATVNPLPASIAGSDSVCVLSSVSLTETTTGGTWSSSATAAAIVGSTGIVTGSGVGTATISYTLSTGCYATFVITANPIPGFISGSSTVCANATVTLSEFSSGGTWSSGNTAVATIGSTTGIVFGVSAGPVVISYAFSTGCFATFDMTVTAVPAAIAGSSPVCAGSTTTLSDATTGGTWSSTAVTSIATISGSGVVSGVSFGTTTISYTYLGCASMLLFTVDSLPSPISGIRIACTGSSTTLSDPGGGTWASSNTVNATIGEFTGIVTGIAVGYDTVTYTLPTGCTTTAIVTVALSPSGITGRDSICVYAMTTLNDVTTGGTWSSSYATVATINSTTGLVSGVSSGATFISYTVPDGCYATYYFSVDSASIVPPISGTNSLCVFTSTALSDAVTGGTWSSSSSLGSITSGGVFTAGSSPGIAIVAYTVNNDCGTTIAYDTITIFIPNPPIMGNLGVCLGSWDTLFNADPGGTWSSSNTAIAFVWPDGLVYGVAAGSVTITYAVTTPCGSYTATRTVAVNMLPFITTNTKVACQSLAASFVGQPPVLGNPYMLPDTGCVLVCDSSVARYYANGNGGTYTWAVTGGIVVNNYGDSIDVLWPFVGTTGTITLSDTAGDCVGTTSGCVQVIERPQALFSTGPVNFCFGTPVVFSDLSTADPLSPIVSWFWNFGDGTGSSAPSPPNHVYAASGTYTVQLTVKNACNCSSTYSIVLIISQDPGPAIVCPSIVCDSGIAEYSTATSSCKNYDWSVVGGTILAGTGTASITVQWNDVGPGGFGYVNLVTDCPGTCIDTTTIRIPVILQSPVISGPSVICAGQQYEYSFPLWPATQYRWGVLGFPGDIVGAKDDYKMVVEIDSPGTYTIHGWYQNELELCGANVDTQITVVPAVEIDGNTVVCQYSDDTLSLSDPTLTGNWILSDPTTGSVVATGSGNSFSNTFSTAGTYVLSVSGDFCADPITISVEGAPPTIGGVYGPVSVCLGHLYGYLTYYDVPGTTYNWQAIGGTVTPASGGPLVSVVWTSTGAKYLIVSRVSTTSPFCSGLPDTISIGQSIPIADISGNATPCANSSDVYGNGWDIGDDYDWTILPTTAGSVVSGNHSPTISALWNNVAGGTTASVIVAVHQCDSVRLDTFTVTITASPTATISASATTVCPGTPINFTAASGGVSYLWSFGDGSSRTTTGNTISHAFPPNISSSNMSYAVQVTILPNPAATCPAAGSAAVTVQILPGPVASLSSADYMICAPDSALLVASVTDNVSGLTYVWGNSGAVISGATSTTYKTNVVGIYTYTVTASNGCSNISNPVGVSYGPCTGGRGEGYDCNFGITKSNNCNTITLSASSISTGTWMAAVPPITPLGSGLTVTATYDVPGIYNFTFTGTTSVCGFEDFQSTVDTVGIVPDFYYNLTCDTGGMDIVHLHDISAYLPFWAIDSITWVDLTSGLPITTSPNPVIARTAGASYVIQETVHGTKPGGTYSCSVTHTVTLPNGPSAAFTYSVSPICEGIPISFTPTATAGVVTYNWYFGDTSSTLLENPERTYKWNGTSPGVPQPDTVVLIVTDSIGCMDSVSHIMSIYENLLNGRIGVSGVICAGPASYSIAFVNLSVISPTAYVWSSNAWTTGITTVTTTVPTLDIYESSSYWVTVSDANQCQLLVNPAVTVKVLAPPPAVIYGQLNYCAGDVVSLSGYTGTGLSYLWYRDSVLVSTIPTVLDGPMAAGTYAYMLVLTETDTTAGTITPCSDTAIDTIRVYSQPASPTISGPSVVACSMYALQLTASDSVAGTFIWSNDSVGAVDNINSGGPYRVWFTDLNGCQSESDVYVPLSPDTYFPYFPTGCYSICNQQLPVTISGPPNIVFSSWAWLANGSVVSSGTDSTMASYTIDSSGDYQWALDNGLCADTTDTMDVTGIQCSACNTVAPAVTIDCTPGNPASYSMIVDITSPVAGCTYTIGTDIGPVDPFSGLFTTSGPQPPLTLTFTTLYTTPLPDSVTFEITFTIPGNPTPQKCYMKKRLRLPRCSWINERTTPQGDTIAKADSNIIVASNAMLVFPNPTSGNVTISYDYGTDQYRQREITVYDAMGTRKCNENPQDIRGNWIISTNNWMPGIYLIRMDADGKALQTQRMVVVSR